ncbi:MAG: translocation/assembly module TamB domain-containing protein [Steroidobacteraceae bacterium]
MRRFLTLSGLLILLVTALAAAAVYFVLFTQSGLRFVVAHLPQRFGTAEVRIEQVSGTLATVVRAQRVVIDQRHVTVRLEGIATRVRLSALSWRTLVSRDTTVADAYVHVKPVPPLPAAHPQFLPWWLDIRILHAHVGALAVVLENGRRLQGEDLDGSVQITHRDLRIAQLTLRTGQTAVALAVQLHAAHPLRLSGRGDFTWRPRGGPPWVGSAALRGDLARLTVSAHLLAPFKAALNGQLRGQDGRWTMRSELGVRDLDLRTWHRTDRFGRISAQLALTGGIDAFTVGGTVDPAGLRVGAFQVELAGRYAHDVLTARRVAVRHLASGAALSAAGTVRFVGGRPDLALQGVWRALRWPLAGAARLQSPSGQFTLAGRLPYAVTAQGLAQIGPGAPIPVTVSGTVASTGLSVERSTLGVLGGQLAARGTLAWLPVERWSVQLSGSGIDPGMVRPALRGRVGFALSASGEGFGAAASLRMHIKQLSGRVRGQTASGGGRIARDQGVWSFQHLRVNLGQTRLALDGRVAREVNLRFALAGDLHLLSAADRGRIDAAGSIEGPLAAPQVRASVSGSALQVGANSLASLVAHVDFDPTSRHPSNVTVQLRQLRSRHRQLRSLDFALSGPASHLTARLEAIAPGLRVAATADGSFAAGVFNGQITALNVSGPQSLQLHERQAASLLLSSARSELGALCLDGTPGALCTGATWTPGAWSAYLTASALPLATLTAGMTPTVEYQGTIGTHIELTGGAGRPLEGTLRMSLADGVLSRRLVSGRIEHTSIGSGLLLATARPGVIHAQATLSSGAIGSLEATLEVGRDVADWHDMPLKGTVHVQTARLNLISLYLPGVDAVSGVLVVDATVGGTVADPRLSGSARIVKASADLYRTNLQMRDLTLTAQLSEGGFRVDGTAHVGKGLLHVDGQMGWRDSLPFGVLHLRGSDLRVVDLPEARIDASPSLDFRLTDRRIDVTGTVFISHARITPRNFSGAVRASSDQLIVGEESAESPQRYQVVTAITFDLGNDVNIDTMGLTGNLSGRISVRSGFGQGTTATGELFVQKGQYSAYARQLSIQSGRLFFRGGPIDNPGIEIRAVRRYPDVTAGINVSGTLRQPQVSFFSNPALSQSQIMSLILSGGGGSLQALQTSAAAQTQQTTAASELLAQGGAILAQQLGSRIGLPDVSLQTDLNNQTSLVLGKYLSPRLYVSYGVGLTEQLSAVRLRYSIGKNWTIRIEAGQGKLAGQSKSGELGGADLVFTIAK